MSSFSALMALSASQTKATQSVVESALRERQRKEEQKRKQIEEKEAKEREIEKKLRLKHFEDEKREQERRRRLEEEHKTKEAALQRREEEQRDALRYGPKKAAKLSSSEGSQSKWGTPSNSRETVRKNKLDVDEEDPGPGGLTREELRERKQQAELRRLYQTSKRSSQTSSYMKPGRRLPGGAVDMMASSQSPDSGSGQSVKHRLAAMPNTLMKLNVKKRDTRTIDEILQDRAKAKELKVLDGDDARGFSDWFGSSKKETHKPSAQTGSAATSGANTPASQSSNLSTSTSAPTNGKKQSNPIKSTPQKLIPKQGSSLTSKSALTSSRTGTAEKQPVKSNLPKINKTSSAAERPNTSKLASSNKKRPRSSSRSESPQPKRRHQSSELEEDIGSTIWKLFGRDRTAYVAKDVMSDDEDMEADARVLEREEKLSARIAKKEELQALEEERRHEEEKRKRKKERERASVVARA